MKISDESPYKEFINSKKKETTRETYAYNLAMIRRELGKEVHKANKSELRDFILKCRDKGLKGSTIQSYKAVLASFFKWEIQSGHREDDPSALARGIDTGVASKINPKALSQDEQQNIFDCLNWDTIQEYQKSLAIYSSFKLGLRRFEIAKLRFSDANFETGMMKVVGKGRSEEEPDFVPMSEEYKKRFLEFKRMVEASGILTDWVFFKEGASDFHYHKWNIWNWHKTIGKRCGIALHTHRGRHSLCTRLNESEIALFTKQKISRHKSPEMLLRYTKIDNKDVIDAVHKAIP